MQRATQAREALLLRNQDPNALTVGQILYLLCSSKANSYRDMHYFNLLVDRHGDNVSRKNAIVTFLGQLADQQLNAATITFLNPAFTVPTSQLDPLLLTAAKPTTPLPWWRARGTTTNRQESWFTLNPVLYFERRDEPLDEFLQSRPFGDMGVVTPEYYAQNLDPRAEPWKNSPTYDCETKYLVDIYAAMQANYPQPPLEPPRSQQQPEPSTSTQQSQYQRTESPPQRQEQQRQQQSRRQGGTKRKAGEISTLLGDSALFFSASVAPVKGMFDFVAPEEVDQKCVLPTSLASSTAEVCYQCISVAAPAPLLNELVRASQSASDRTQFTRSLLRDARILARDRRADLLEYDSPVAAVLSIANALQSPDPVSLALDAIASFATAIESQEGEEGEETTGFYYEVERNNALGQVVCEACIRDSQIKRNAVLPVEGVDGQPLSFQRSIPTVKYTSTVSKSTVSSLLPFANLRANSRFEEGDAAVLATRSYDWFSGRVGPYGLRVGGLALARTGLTPNLALVRVRGYHTIVISTDLDAKPIGNEPYMIEVEYVYPAAPRNQRVFAVTMDACYPILKWPSWQSFVEFRSSRQPDPPTDLCREMYGKDLAQQHAYLLERAPSQRAVSVQDVVAMSDILRLHEDSQGRFDGKTIALVLNELTSEAAPDAVVAPHLKRAFGSDVLNGDIVLAIMARIFTEIDAPKDPYEGGDVFVRMSAEDQASLAARVDWGREWRHYRSGNDIDRSMDENTRTAIAQNVALTAYAYAVAPHAMKGYCNYTEAVIQDRALEVAATISGVNYSPIGRVSPRQVIGDLFPFLLGAPPNQTQTVNSIRELRAIAESNRKIQRLMAFYEARIEKDWSKVYDRHYQAVLAPVTMERENLTRSLMQSQREWMRARRRETAAAAYNAQEMTAGGEGEEQLERDVMRQLQTPWFAAWYDFLTEDFRSQLGPGRLMPAVSLTLKTLLETNRSLIAFTPDKVAKSVLDDAVRLFEENLSL